MSDLVNTDSEKMKLADIENEILKQVAPMR